MLPKASIFALSILIAGIIGLIRSKKIDETFYPFIIVVWLACINEVLGCILELSGHYTAVNNNIYVLTEAILFTFLFKNLGIFDGLPQLFPLLISFFIVVWIWENFIHSKIIYVSSWFRVIYSFLIVLMSITVLNKLIIGNINKSIERTSSYLLKDPVLLLCIGSIVYFTFKILIEIFWLYGLNQGRDFRVHIYQILVYINLAVNFIYALAILWAPPKQQYMIQY